MPMDRPRVVVYCRVWFGSGHWMRTSAIMAAMARRFAVTAIVDGALTPDLPPPAGVDTVFLPPPDPARPVDAMRRRVEALVGVLERDHPAALVIEYFPFGRIEVVQELTRCLMAARRRPHPPLVVCSLRDIQQRLRPNQAVFDRDAATLVNRYFDAVLVHADPAFVRFEDTVANAAAIRAAVHHTGYVAADPAPLEPRPRDGVVVVSAGGGRGGDQLLLSALAAQRETDLPESFAMRIIAGTLVADDTWRALNQGAVGCPRLEVVRWVPDLAGELAGVAVSVSRCGYNTAIDLVRSRVPALVVPYATPQEDEQTMRADRLARAGLVRVLAETSATPARLAGEIRTTAAFRPEPATLDFNGAEHTADLLQAMLQAGNGTACSS